MSTDVERLQAELAGAKARVHQLEAWGDEKHTKRLIRIDQLQELLYRRSVELEHAQAERDALKAELDRLARESDANWEVARAELAEARATIERTQHLLSTLVHTADVLAALDAPQRPEDTRDRPKLITGNGMKRRHSEELTPIYERPEDTREETGRG